MGLATACLGPRKRTVPDGDDVLQITTNRYGDIHGLDALAAAFLNISRRRVTPYNLLNFFIEGRLQLAADLRAAGTVPFPEREAVLRPKERAARRVLVSVCEIEDTMLWTVRDLGLAQRKPVVHSPRM